MSAIEQEKFTHYIHEYERSSKSKEIYRCVHPRCMHYSARHYLVGKDAICHKCKNIFPLTWAQLRNKKPVCDFCTKSPKAEQLRFARDLAFKALDEIPDELKAQIIDETLE